MQVYSATALEKAVLETFLAWFGTEEPAITGQLCFMVNSMSDKEKHEWLGQAPHMDVFKDQVKMVGLSSTGFEILNDIFTGGLTFSRDDLRRNQTASFKIRIQQLAAKARWHNVKLLMEAIEANPTGYDGVTIFNGAHPARKNEGSTQDNDLAITGSTTANIQTDLALALQAMLGFLDEEADPFHGDGMNPQLLVVCPPGLLRNMREALQATIISNTTNVNAGMADLYASARITASTWYMFRVDGPRAWICQEEQPVMVEAVESGSTAVVKRQFEYVVSRSGNVGPGFWQSAIKVA